MPELDPTIIEHHIDTWSDSPPIRQQQHPIHPEKVTNIKAKIKKI